MRRIFCVKRRERRCCHRVYRVDRAPRGGPVFYYLRRGPFKAMPGNERRSLKERGPRLTQINAASERESSCVYADARVCGFTRERRGPRRFTAF